MTTDDKNARNIDVNLWAMTNQETGEYGVSHSICGCNILFLINTINGHNNGRFYALAF